MFDKNPDTFFDSQSKTYCDNDLRLNGGCLRVDFGKELSCDSVEIEFFSTDTPTREVKTQCVPVTAEYSSDLEEWKNSDTVQLTVKEKMAQEIVKFTVHTTYFLDGKRMISSYPVNDKLRYLRIEAPVDRIFAVRLIKDGKDITPEGSFGNNMQAHYRYKKTQLVKYGEISVPADTLYDKITVAVEGAHGEEGVYLTAETAGKYRSFPDRAPEYKANQWEHRVMGSDKNNTFSLDITEDMKGKKVKIYALFSDRRKGEECGCRVYFTVKHR